MQKNFKHFGDLWKMSHSFHISLYRYDFFDHCRNICPGRSHKPAEAVTLKVLVLLARKRQDHSPTATFTPI